MKKRLLTTFLTMALLLSAVTVPALAADLPDSNLNPSHRGTVPTGENYKDIEAVVPENVLGGVTSYDPADPAADFTFWHFVQPGAEDADYAKLVFRTAAGEEGTFTVQPRADDQHLNHYVVVTPSDWVLADGVSYPLEGGKFNLSHGGRHEAELGTVTVTAEVDAWHNEIMPCEYYDRTVDTYYERGVDEYYERTVNETYERTVDTYYERPVFNFYERNVDEYYERSVTEHYERPVTDIFQRYAVKYFVPVFEKKLEGAFDGTLVTRLTYSGTDKKAAPVNGGAFKNGHTYVTVDVEKASREGGVDFVIADSSKNNGKKTPDQYNRPLQPGYTYNVRIADGKLTVSFPEDLAYASVGCQVWDKAPKEFKNAPKHDSNTVTVDLPKNDGTVDLYVHIERLGWYETDVNGKPVYVFKEWKYDHTEEGRDWVYVETTYGAYELTETVKGDWEKVDTVYGAYDLVKTTYGAYELVDTRYGAYQLVDTAYGDWALADTVYGAYQLVDTVCGDYELVGTDRTGQRVEDTYTGTLTLTVDGEPAELDTELALTPGGHVFVLYGDGEELASKTVNILAGEETTVALKAEVRGGDVILDTDKVYADRDATPHYADKAAVRHEEDHVEKTYTDKAAETHYADGKVDDNYADRTATIHSAERPAEKHYADGEVTELKKEAFLYRPDVKLGSETDPDGEYAVKLN